MTRQRTSIRLLLLIPAVMLAAHAAHAGALRDAYDKQSEAFTDYYHGLRQLGPGATKEQVEQLKSKTLAPADYEFAKAWGEQIEKVEQGIRRNMYDEIKSLLLGGDLAQKVRDGKQFAKDRKVLQGKNSLVKGAKGGNTAVTRVTPTATPSVESSKPETVLDGSKVPKEIEFTPAPRKTSRPSK